MTQFPGGWLAGRYGGKHVFGWSMLVCALATLLTPLAAQTSVPLLMIVRAIAGLGQVRRLVTIKYYTLRRLVLLFSLALQYDFI